MRRAPLRLLFCLAAATVAAALGDVLVESASNAGCFGPGRFTDRSMVDVIPALFAGMAVALANLGLRLYALLGRRRPTALLRASDEALRGAVARLLPAIFGLQIAILFAMETAEQFAVWHHTLGGTIWLGGPTLASLAIHAAVCIVVSIAVAFGIRSLAATTVRIVAFVRQIAASATRANGALPAGRYDERVICRSFLLRNRRFGRAPPIQTRFHTRVMERRELCQYARGSFGFLFRPAFLPVLPAF